MSVQIFHGDDCISEYVEFMLMESNLLYLPKDKPILLKVNMIMNASSSTGITTAIEIVEPLVEIFAINGFKVIVGDGGDSTCETMISLRNNGYEDMCNKYGAKLVDLNKGPAVDKIIGGVPMFINKYALDSNVISIAKLKPHSVFKVTGTLKNLMGTVLPKGRMHDNFTAKIEDVYNYIKPVYGIIDGIIANGNCENVACPIKMDTILCGENLPQVDLAESKILGRSAEHIMNLYKKSNPSHVLDDHKLNELAKLYSNGGL